MDFTFISGATGGIGKAFVFECARNGCNLFLTGRDVNKLLALKEEVYKLIKDVLVEVFPCNLADEKDRLKMYAFMDEKGLKFERIINVAGIDIQKAFMKYTEDKIIKQIRVNNEATLSITHALLSRRSVFVEIVTISSMSSSTPMPYFAIYSATKKMLVYFFKALRVELKDKGVKVTTVLPGGVPTRPDIINDIKHQGLWGKLTAKSPEFIATKSLKKVKKNKAIYIPGFFNRLLNFFTSIIPHSISMKVVKKRWKDIEKDAF